MQSPAKKRRKTGDAPETPGDEDALENDGIDDNDAEESLADASQDDGESRAMDQDGNESNDE